jgi:formate dehydrogenase subunit beta
MNTQWMLQDRGDTLVTIQQFLRDLWQTAALEGMLVPQRTAGTAGIRPLFITDWMQLNSADPCAPVMTLNAARLVAQLARENPRGRLGAVLRSCELRSLLTLAAHDAFHLEQFLIIGVDCLGTFPADDYAWRAEKQGVEQLTREALRFAPQGGLLPHRYRHACQMCVSPVPEGADLSIGILGLPTRQTILITARNEETAERLRLDAITDGEAAPSLVARHEKMRATLAGRRGRARRRIIGALPASLPANVQGLLAQLTDCAPCQACLEACPIYAGELARLGGVSWDAVRRWLSTCAECGMCEEACPRRMPLSAVVSRIRWDLVSEWIAV